MDWKILFIGIMIVISVFPLVVFILGEYDLLPSTRRTLPEAPKKKVTIREHWEDGTQWDEEYLLYDFQDPLQELRHVYGVAGYVHRRDGNAIHYGRIKSIELIKQEELK